MGCSVLAKRLGNCDIRLGDSERHRGEYQSFRWGRARCTGRTRWRGRPKSYNKEADRRPRWGRKVSEKVTIEKRLEGHGAS